MKTAIIGTGLIGSGWAIVFARAGFDVALYDGVTARPRVPEPHRGACARPRKERPHRRWR